MRPKLLRRPALCLPVLALAACNVITDGAPIWDMTWNVPAKSTSISVNTLLPAGVSAVGNAFQANVSAIAPIVRTLGTDCAACAAANGQTIAKPAFTMSTTSVAALPSGVASATLVTDTIIVTVTNGYNFDPINPGGGAAGSIRLTATSGATTLGTQTFSGPASAIPAGQTTTFKLPISGAVGAAGISVAANIDSPQGPAIVIDASRQITIAPSVKGAVNNTVLISAASVALVNQSVSASPTNLDLSSIDESVRKRVTGGKLVLTITNPFSVSGNLNLDVSGVAKTVALAAGSATAAPSTVVVDFTQDEISRILGTNGQITVQGAVSGSTAVTSGQTLAVATRLQLTLCTDSEGANVCK